MNDRSGDRAWELEGVVDVAKKGWMDGWMVKLWFGRLVRVDFYKVLEEAFFVFVSGVVRFGCLVCV